MQMAPLIAALKTESQLQDLTLELLPKVLLTHLHSSFSYFHPSSSLSFGKKRGRTRNGKTTDTVGFFLLYWFLIGRNVRYNKMSYYIIKGLYYLKFENLKKSLGNVL